MLLKKHLYVAAILLSLPLLATANSHSELGITVPPEMLMQRGAAQPAACLQCCLYANNSYSEGAIIKTEGILLQCSRDAQVLSTNPLIWQRIKP